MVTAGAGTLKDAVSFYEDCEDRSSSYPGVKISSSIAVIDGGRFSRCFKMERRTYNALPNGDFMNKTSGSFLYRDNAKWRQHGGIDNSSCLEITGGEVVIPLVELEKNSANAFSFYAKSNTNATISVSLESEGKTNTLMDNIAIGNAFKRIDVPFAAHGDSASLRLNVSSSIIIDDAQLDKGVNFFNSFSKPLKLRNVDTISIPADKQFFDAAKGAVSAWVNVPWLNSKNIISNSSCCLFAVKNAKKKINKWGDHIVMVMNCIPQNKPDTERDNSLLYFFTIDSEERPCKVSERLLKLPDTTESGWRHLVYNWELKSDDNMKISIWLDGEKLTETSKPFGPVKKPEFINIGYFDGAYLNGLVDDFAIFNRPLTEVEIQKLFNSNTPISHILQEGK